MLTVTRQLRRIKKSLIAVAQLSQWKVCLKVDPSTSLIDEKVDIQVHGLPPRKDISLQAKITGDKGERFESSAHYIADEHGTVSVSSQPSVGGSYTGIEPMGLLWSMEPSPGQKKGIRLFKRDVTKPYVVSVDVFGGHLRLGRENESVGEPLSSGTFEKWYMKDGVKRIPVREGRVRGTLFLPPGDGPFPGVMKIVGSAGRPWDWWSSLLASRGFASLALAYWDFDDLPPPMTPLDLDYFEEAASFLGCHPKINSAGIGVVGISKGAELALLLAAHTSNLIRGVVAISPPNLIVVCPVKVKGKLIKEVDDENRVWETSNQDLVMWDRVPPEFKLDIHSSSPEYIPVENINCPVLIGCGKDDQALEAAFMAGCLYKRMAKNGKGSLCTVISYDGAGHIIQVPYQPCHYIGYHSGWKRCLVFGGEMKSHAKAEEDFWLRVLQFLGKNLT